MSRKKDFFKEIKKFWNDVVNDEEISIQHRLKASELLIKAGGENGENGENNMIVVVIEGESEL